VTVPGQETEAIKYVGLSHCVRKYRKCKLKHKTSRTAKIQDLYYAQKYTMIA